MKKVVFKLDTSDERVKQKAMRNVSGLPGLVSIATDMKHKKLTVEGDVDPVVMALKLKKICATDIISVGPTKKPEKKKDKYSCARSGGSGGERKKVDQDKRARDKKRADEEKRAREKKRADEEKRVREIKRADEEKRAREIKSADEEKRVREIKSADEEKRAREKKRADEEKRAREKKKAGEALKSGRVAHHHHTSSHLLLKSRGQILEVRLRG